MTPEPLRTAPPLFRRGLESLRRPRSLLLLLSLTGLVAAPAPAGADGPKPSWQPVTVGEPGWAIPPRGPDDPVVARINGVAIPLSQVRRQLSLSPAGTTPRQALDALVDEELLAQRASELQFGLHFSVLDGWKKRAVQRLLATEFEPGTARDKLPEELLRRAYERNRSFFLAPERRLVAHWLLPLKKDDSPELVRSRQQEAALLEASLRREPPTSKDQFLERGKKLRSGARPDLVVEDLGEIALHGAMVRDFSRAAFELPADGSLSHPVRTSFGWHLIYRYGSAPPRNVTFAQARGEILDRTWPDWRSHEFQLWLEARLATCRVERHEEVLGDGQVLNPSMSGAGAAPTPAAAADPTGPAAPRPGAPPAASPAPAR